MSETQKELITKEQVTEIVELQITLNNNTCGIGWEETRTTDKGRKLDFMLAFILEVSEAIESTPWKWWKSIDVKPDYNNIKIELVDALHFLISDMLLVVDKEKVIEILHTSLNLPSPDYGDEITIKDALKVTLMYANADQNYMFLQRNVDVMKVQQYLTSGITSEYNEEEASLRESLLRVFNDMVMAKSNIISGFMDALNLIPGFTKSDLYRLYIGKNVLNQFRQDNGYKENTYIKTWNGDEDNVAMYEMMAKHENINSTVLYELLTVIYTDVVKNLG